MSTGLTATAANDLLRLLAQLPLRAARLVGRVGPPLQLDISVGTTATDVPHPLGAVPRMVVLGPPDVQATVWQPVAPDRNKLTLQADVACVVRAFVFLPRETTMSDNTVLVADTTTIAPTEVGPPPAGTTQPTRVTVELDQTDLQLLNELRVDLALPARGGRNGQLAGLAGALRAAVRIASKSAKAHPKAAMVAAGFSHGVAARALGIGKQAAATRAARRAPPAVELLPGEKVDLSEPARAVQPFFAPEGASSPHAPDGPGDAL